MDLIIQCFHDVDILGLRKALTRLDVCQLFQTRVLCEYAAVRIRRKVRKNNFLPYPRNSRSNFERRTTTAVCFQHENQKGRPCGRPSIYYSFHQPFGKITILRRGSSPMLSVVTAGWLRNAIWITRRSLAGMGSSVALRPVLITWSAMRFANCFN